MSEFRVRKIVTQVEEILHEGGPLADPPPVKGAIYAIYNRALRDDPALQGKVVLKLSIAPSGQVTDIRIESSELKAADLEAKLLARIRSFDFGAKDVNPMTVTYPLDFLPS